MRRYLSTALAALVLAGCAPSGTDSGPSGPVAAEDGHVAITGTDRLRWSADLVTAEPGELTIELRCEEAVNHNLVIDRQVIAECPPGGTDRGTVELAPGDHEFVCTIPGHQRSMRGTIRVG